MNETPAIGAIDERAIRVHRAERIRRELRRQEHEAVLVADPVNLRYALAFADGPTVLFDLAIGRHLSAGLESVSEVRPSVPFDYMVVADNFSSPKAAPKC